MEKELQDKLEFYEQLTDEQMAKVFKLALNQVKNYYDFNSSLQFFKTAAFGAAVQAVLDSMEKDEIDIDRVDLNRRNI
jgi:hypothetical protein